MAEIFTSFSDTKLITLLQRGAIGVIPTDTIYGIVTKALNARSVDTLYTIRKRPAEKPSIVLISSFEDLNTFFVSLTVAAANKLHTLWPGKVSVILDAPHPDLAYLHKGTDTIAFRMPDMPELLEVLKTVGPIIAPSANLEGKPPATTYEAAYDYFGDELDFYVDIGTVESEPSTVIKIEGDTVKVIREGVVKI